VRAFLFVLVLSVLALNFSSALESSEPHVDARSRQVEYAGPGREDPEPETPNEVLVAYFGPDDPDHTEGGDLWLASSLAVEEANRTGGFRGVPFRLIPAWSEDPWGTGVARLARAVYDDSVWAVIGSIDGASTHLAEQVVAKARLTLIAPAGTDKTVNYANVAWMFSCLPSDDRWAKLLAEALEDEIGRHPFTLITTTDHDSRAATVELRGSLNRRGVGPLHHLEFEAGTEDLGGLAERVTKSDAEAVVILSGPVDTARLVVALRERRDDLALFGGPSVGRRAFRERAGAAADGVRFPLLCDPAAATSEFGRNFESRFGRRADCPTVQAYDATRLLIAAIRDAGLNRARIRDSVEALSPWPGSAGAVEFGPVGQNRRPVWLGRIAEGGRVVVAGDGPFPSQ
jgi:ABC-type branched-subunit amino acid transport system substrate-binding protein